MARKRKKAKRAGHKGVKDFRHEEATHKNNPPAGIAPTYEVPNLQTACYTYDLYWGKNYE